MYRKGSETMARYSYYDALDETVLNITNASLLVEVESNSYSNVQTGFLAFHITEFRGDYRVYPAVPTGTETVFDTIIMTEGDTIFYKINKPNIYEGAEWVSQDITGLSKEHEVLRAFKAVVDSRYTFGGPAPYVVFSDEVFINTPEAAPIGEAEVGKNLIVE